MKRHLSFITNNQGFILFHTLFIISVSLLLIITSIEIYRNNLAITNKQIEYIEHEALFQMGQVKLMHEINESGLPEEELTYLFPTGKVTVRNATTDKSFDVATFFFIISFHESPELSSYLTHRFPYDFPLSEEIIE